MPAKVVAGFFVHLTTDSWALQASRDPLKVMVQHLRDDKYDAQNDVLKVGAQHTAMLTVPP